MNIKKHSTEELEQELKRRSNRLRIAFYYKHNAVFIHPCYVEVDEDGYIDGYKVTISTAEPIERGYTVDGFVYQGILHGFTSERYLSRGDTLKFTIELW